MKARLKIISSMAIFGTIGIVRRFVPFSSPMLALLRGVIGLAVLILFAAILRKPLSRAAVRKNLWLLLFSGTALGLNWVLLFEAYNYTTVATATLCYYLAPAIITFASPVVLHEKLTVKKTVCAVLALVGMFFISGMDPASVSLTSELKGVLFGLAAAALYASVVLLNRKMSGIGAGERTAVQLGVSSLVLLLWLIPTGGLSVPELTTAAVLLTVLMGVVHTGLAYLLYFSALEEVPSQTAAVLSYLDPVVAIMLSALVLREPFGWREAAGTVLILGSALVSEIAFKRRAGDAEP